MLNVIFVSDNLDAQIGSNCTLAHNHFTGEVDLQEHNVVLLQGNDCTAENVQNSITSFDGAKFILAAFSHGSQEALISSAEVNGYVHAGNTYYFSSSVVYTNCCHSGAKLKDYLIQAGCIGYVGYTDVVRLPRNVNDDILFIACENSGLVHFLTTNATLTQSVEFMKSKYLEQRRAFLNNRMNVSAALLFRNMNCLTYYDNGATREILEN
ncbi:hypothetical protein HDF19_00650 [Mucilaginibacter sp. E4BP6]|uniref:hypothetical protein n=1 Tax=Mucilaginibacter sp. E4BP6 TaxID=2723089 RepID=UPI0015CD73E0|nr:hypothetical protein [Mucilaginibacter sp. E4BP6]NYE66911.1 hypothetical protein [Mucilaginibacter sp. E4BP6]